MLAYVIGNKDSVKKLMHNMKCKHDEPNTTRSKGMRQQYKDSLFNLEWALLKDFIGNLKDYQR